jgi:hypothetical protein
VKCPLIILPFQPKQILKNIFRILSDENLTRNDY